MNLIEALKTGKPLRRRKSAAHIGSHKDGYLGSEYVMAALLDLPFVISDDPLIYRSDLLADDWEIREDSK